MPLLGKTKQTVLNEFRSGEILESARKVFARKGFADATVDEIAEGAGVAKGTVYLYFPSKRDIYIEALKKGVAEMNELTREHVEQASGSQAKLRAFIATRVHYAEQHRDFFKIYQNEFASCIHPVIADRDLRDLSRRQANVLDTILQAGQEEGVVRDLNGSPVGFLLYEMTRALIVQRMLGWSRNSMEQDIEALCRLVWKGVAR
jgi:AcrR family transcriptional regulator